MTLPAPTYDLMMLLDLEAEEPARAKALADTRAAIEAHGELVRYDEWGERPLAYPIDRRKSADYYLMQFHTSDNELLSSLERTLHITDGVLRFRLIKLRPGVPAPPDMRSGAAAARPPAPEERGARSEDAEQGAPSAGGEDAAAPAPGEQDAGADGQAADAGAGEQQAPAGEDQAQPPTAAAEPEPAQT